MKLNEKLESLNDTKRIKIRAKKLAKGHSLYLDFSKNYDRQRLFIILQIKNADNLTPRDKENLYKAEILRDKKELELFQSETDFVLKNKASRSDLIKYMEKLTTKRGLPCYQGCSKHLKNFVEEKYKFQTLQFNMVDRKFCVDFLDYLLTKIAHNTARSYIKILNAGLNKAIEEGFIRENPCKGINIKYQDAKREFLTESEIKAFAEVDTNHIEIQNAFLFSCMSGLRAYFAQSVPVVSLKVYHHISTCISQFN